MMYNLVDHSLKAIAKHRLQLVKLSVGHAYEQYIHTHYSILTLAKSH